MRTKHIVVATIVIILFFIGMMSFMSNAEAFNATLFDTTYRFDKVQIHMPDGRVVTGAVESWKDWDDSDAVQIKVDGKTYYTHLSRVVLIAE